jgi:hypothetical protein
MVYGYSSSLMARQLKIDAAALATQPILADKVTKQTKETEKKNQPTIDPLHAVAENKENNTPGL